MLLETPRPERARVLSKGAATGGVFALMAVCAMAGLGLIAVPSRTARRRRGAMLVISLRCGEASFDFLASRNARVRPKKASLVILPRLVSGLSGSRGSPQPSPGSARG